MSSSWSRACLAAALLAWAGAAAAQYAGTWVAKHPGGGSITLVLEQQGPGEVIGTIEGSGARFEVDAEVRADGIVGMVSSPEAMVHLTGRINGPTLFIVLIEPGPGGEPDLQSRRVIRFSKAGGQSQ